MKSASNVFKEREGINSGKGNRVQVNMLSSIFKANSPDFFQLTASKGSVVTLSWYIIP